MKPADELRKLRAALGVTQRELGERLGVSTRTVMRWENGQIEARASVLDLMRRWLAEGQGPRKKKRAS